MNRWEDGQVGGRGERRGGEKSKGIQVTEKGGSRMEKRFREPKSSKANDSILITESFKYGNYLGKSHIATILSTFFFQYSVKIVLS